MSKRQKYFNKTPRKGEGLIIGFSIGAAIGFAVNNFALWIAIGMVLGIAYESWILKEY